ncbi:MAG: hypothetical protein ACFFDH_24700 [Promethearchaeota archaeon]
MTESRTDEPWHWSKESIDAIHKKIGIMLCLIGGTMSIMFWFFPCIFEVLNPSQYYLPGFCLGFIYALIVGAFGIIGAMIGWKIKKKGYLLSVGTAGFALTIYIILFMQQFGLNFYMYISAMSQAFFLGAIFIFVGGIYGYLKS